MKFETESVLLSFVAAGPISEAAVPGRFPQIKTADRTYSLLRIDSTWMWNKYVKVWSCLALRRGKMVFPCSNMMTVHSLIVKRMDMWGWDL